MRGRFSKRQREILSELCLSTPFLTATEVRRIFKKKTRLDVHENWVYYLRRRGGYVPPPKPKKKTIDRPKFRPQLTPNQRESLTILIRLNPTLGPAEIARMFSRSAGRMITDHSVAKMMRRGGYSDYFLTDSQRSMLRDCCQDAAPDYDLSSIAALFTLATGRTIGRTTISDFLHANLGVTLKRGPKVGGRAIEEASEQKLAHAKVDRSARAGRTGKYHGE